MKFHRYMLTIQEIPEDIPPEIIEYFRARATSLLGRPKPQARWEKILAVQWANVKTTWTLCDLGQDQIKAEQWWTQTRDLLDRMELKDFPRAGRMPLEPSAEWLKMKYEFVYAAVKRMRKAKRMEKPRDINKFYKLHLRRVFQELGPVYVGGRLQEKKLTDQLVLDTKMEEPAVAAG
jgi:hypothetical protein